MMMTKASQSLGCDTPEKRCGNAAFTGTSLLVYGPSVKDKSPGTFTLTYVVSLFITQTVQGGTLLHTSIWIRTLEYEGKLEIHIRKIVDSTQRYKL
uniref:(California timema) hypothetical protein n=1 Tax=Timema californicum TaxID=61474 RepID=A0A7R9P318_TIMCA|nr:unnamed protein product [Timema californicum]